MFLTKAEVPTYTVQVTSVDKKEYSGEITKIENRTLTVNTSDGTKQINIPANIQIKKDGADSTFDSIKVNDKVTFAQSNSGELLSVSITSSEVSNVEKIALPVAIALILILGTIFYLIRKNRRGNIKTSTEQVR